MILNSAIWKETVSDAKAKSAVSPAWLRAIDRAVIEIERASYWSFDGHTLAIISTTSGARYNVGDAHTCPARRNICKHRAARQLMLRYSERLAKASPASLPEVAPHSAPVSPASERETAVLIKRQRGGVIIDSWTV